MTEPLLLRPHPNARVLAPGISSRRQVRNLRLGGGPSAEGVPDDLGEHHLAGAGNWHAVQAAIEKLDPERLPGLVLVLLMARAGELNQLRASVAKLGAAPLN